MTYNMFGGTLNLTQLNSYLWRVARYLCICRASCLFRVEIRRSKSWASVQGHKRRKDCKTFGWIQARCKLL